MRRRWGLLAGLAALLAACSEGGDTAESPAVASGRSVYANVCAVCHGADPTQDGTLGPAIAGASRELIEARVLHGEYPPGYTPKRASRTMPVYPYVEPKLSDLAAYLAEAADGS